MSFEMTRLINLRESVVPSVYFGEIIKFVALDFCSEETVILRHNNLEAGGNEVEDRRA